MKKNKKGKKVCTRKKVKKRKVNGEQDLKLKGTRVGKGRYKSRKGKVKEKESQVKERNRRTDFRERKEKGERVGRFI